MVTTHDLASLGRLIDALAGTPALTKRQIVDGLRPQIAAALARGVGFTAIADSLMKEANVSIHPNTLRLYYKNSPNPCQGNQVITEPGQPSTPPQTRSTDRLVSRPPLVSPHPHDQPVPRAGTFIPKPEVPLEDLLRQAEAERQTWQAEPAREPTVGADPLTKPA